MIKIVYKIKKEIYYFAQSIHTNKIIIIKIIIKTHFKLLVTNDQGKFQNK